MIKIIATSDWHLGETFHSSDRLEEQKHFLNWLTNQVKEHNADALLVAGDIFDNSNPSAHAQQTYYNFISEITLLCPDLTTVIIAGNHDSALRLTAPYALLKKHKVEVRGSVGKFYIEDENGIRKRVFSTEDLIIPIYSKDKSERVLIAALPYVRSTELSPNLSYQVGMKNLISQLMDNADSLRKYHEPIIMIAHFYATGAEIADNSSENIIIGGLEHLDITGLSEHPTCLMCGHIHKRQTIWNTDWAYYTGSPLAMSFAEKDNHHGVYLISIDNNSLIEKPHFLEYTPQRKLIEISPEGDLSLDEVITEIKKIPLRDDDHPETMSYVSVKLKQNDINLSSRKLIEDQINKRHAIFSKLQCVETAIVTDTTGNCLTKETSLDDIYNRDPMDAVIIGFIKENKLEMTEHQKELARIAINEALNDD